MEGLESAVRDGVDLLIPVVEAVGAAVIAAGVLAALGVWALARLRLRPASYEDVRLLLGRYIALGIEFQLASDVLGTAVAPTYDQLGRLAAVAGIRTVLNLFLAKEIERAGRMEAEGLLRPIGGVTPAPAWRQSVKRGAGRPSAEVADR